MDKLTDKKALLANIRLSENDNFKDDENAILNTYRLQSENTSSLAIKILSIFGGFLAMLAFVGFLFVGGLYKSEIGLLSFGIIFIIAAVWLNSVYDKLIIDTFSISIYIAGLILFFMGITGLKVDDSVAIVFIILFAITSLILVQNYILSFISVVIISGSFIYLIFENDVYNLLHVYIALFSILLAYVFLNEAKIISKHHKISKLYNPLRIGLIFSLLFGLSILGKKGFVKISENYIWISSVVLCIVIFYVVNKIMNINELKKTQSKTIIYSLTLLILLPTLFAPSIPGAILIILLSFLVNYKSGFVIGIISLIYFISQYYYDLNFTLLTQSILLFSSGIAFILAYIFISKNTTIDEKI
jgi:hypothetical protein